MDAHTITIYRSRDTLRVVKGEHKPHDGSSACRVTVYPNAQLAYTAETQADVRASILRIDPNLKTDAVTTFVPAKKSPPAYQWEMYDVLQSLNGPADRPWLDFETIKDAETASMAATLVRLGMFDSKPLAFRIVRYQSGVGNVPVYERVQS